MITVAELKNAITERCQAYLTDFPLAKRQPLELPLLDAVNYVLAQEITASFDIPRQNLSAMDGFAFAKDSDISQKCHPRHRG